MVGKVWSGYVGEYKKPPIYLIQKPYWQKDEVDFIDDILRSFLRKEVRITIEQMPTNKKESGK